MSTTVANALRLQANVILTDMDTEIMKVLILIEPDLETIEQLKVLTFGKSFPALVIKDIRDNGDERTIVDDREHIFVMNTDGSPHHKRVRRICFKFK